MGGVHKLRGRRSHAEVSQLLAAWVWTIEMITQHLTATMNAVSMTAAHTKGK